MNARTRRKTKSPSATIGATPTFAIFTLPKPFRDPHIACIQHNAIASWRALGDDIEVILIGNDEGVKEAAIELNVRHLGNVEHNEHGTPLVNSAFEIAKAATDADVLIYCNADVILLHDFRIALTDVLRSNVKNEFLAIGRRTNLDVDNEIDFDDRMAVRDLLEKTLNEGTFASIVCKEYFAFPRGLFDQIPPFAVGRGNWDNWMVANTKHRHVPVVDLSKRVTAIHQNHDYHHIKSDSNRRRKHCYFAGSEAQENQSLAGGRHIVSGSTASHRLGGTGVVRNRLPWLNMKFWSDLPRFATLVRQLFFG